MLFKKKHIVCVSGFFDPVHSGHIHYFNSIKKKGYKLMVIVNNDSQVKLKKGIVNTPDEERAKIIREFRCVDYVAISIDNDLTQCKTLQNINPRPDFFCTGQYTHNVNIPEADICSSLGIKLIYKITQ